MNDLCYHNNKKRFPRDAHAIFGASKYNWLNYSEDKMIETYMNSKAKKIGTELHELAAGLIKNKVKLPDEMQTLNMYVNDGIYYGLSPEVQLYYSKYFFGTTDTMGVDHDNVLHFHDLKTGKTKASIKQLYIYAAFFFLEYPEYKFNDFRDIELRIYQENKVVKENPGPDIILPIMDKIVKMDKIISQFDDEED